MNAFRQLRRHQHEHTEEHIHTTREVCVYVLLRVHADDDVTVETRSCVICSVFSTCLYLTTNKSTFPMVVFRMR